MLATLAGQLLLENQDLDAFVSRMPDAEWRRVTHFFGWTIGDQIQHLHQIDGFAMASLRGRDSFAETLAAVRGRQANGEQLSDQARAAWDTLSPADMLAMWRGTYQIIAEQLRQTDPRTRLAWFGPDMSPVSMATARLMEVWAHGQDIYDALRIRRVATDRIRNICELGVRTFGWSFRNRDLEPPLRPDITLTAPSGTEWHWQGEGGGTLRGAALDFSLLVTQRRSPEDLALAAEGEGAVRWLPVAQCFAGPPQQPAAPGSRIAL